MAGVAHHALLAGARQCARCAAARARVAFLATLLQPRGAALVLLGAAGGARRLALALPGLALRLALGGARLGRRDSFLRALCRALARRPGGPPPSPIVRHPRSLYRANR